MKTHDYNSQFGNAQQYHWIYLSEKSWESNIVSLLIGGQGTMHDFSLAK
jgi:hypothetical protein